jgi:3'(2'), 5'-bisphosphate nucleotidase/myo-inositol-1(or 4)-monophosphatase
MKLSTDDLLKLSQHAITATYQAGEIISKSNNRSIEVNTKTGGSSLASIVVTEVDLLCQDIILQTLASSCKIYDLAILTEETPDSLERLQKDFFWCIDPLDGTLPFIESISGYAVSIALVSRQGIPYIGIIYDPLGKTLYHAIKNYGVFKNNQTLAISQDLYFINDRSFKKHHLFVPVLTALKKITTQLGYNQLNTIFHGGAAMNACWVLENSPACYFKFPKQDNGGGSIWDYAASACIYTEIGAFVSDIFGNPLALNQPDSTFMNQKGILFCSHDAIAEQIINLFSQLQQYQKIPTKH